MRLLHYSAEPLLTIRSVAQQRPEHFKPSGLWVSAEGEDDWPTWCRDTDFHVELLACVTEVRLRPTPTSCA